MTVSVEKNNTHFTLSTIVIALLSLLTQEHKRIVEVSERIENIVVLLFEADGNGILLQHR